MNGELEEAICLLTRAIVKLGRVNRVEHANDSLMAIRRKLIRESARRRNRRPVIGIVMTLGEAVRMYTGKL